MDTIEEISWRKIQDAENEAVSNAIWDPQTHNLLPAFLTHSNFQIHTNDNSKPAIMLQDTDIPQATRDKLNHMINTQFACIISKLSSDFGRTNW